MAGQKRNKLKKMLSPPPKTDTSPPPSVDDEDLMNDLMAQLDSRDQTVQAESANVLNDMQMNQQTTPSPSKSPDSSKLSKQDPRARYEARQQRKAAKLAEQYSPDNPEADARLRREAEDEERTINRVCAELGLELYEIKPDGHCLFAAIADQLALLGLLPPTQANYAVTRHAAANYIYTHPEDFVPFLPSAGGEDGAGATDAGFMSRPEFEAYCRSIRDTGVWGGEPEILALSRAYNVPIHVVQGGTPPVVVHNPTGAPEEQDVRNSRAVRISYHRRMYGLGEHYNSLRPKTSGMARVAGQIKQQFSQ